MVCNAVVPCEQEICDEVLECAYVFDAEILAEPAELVKGIADVWPGKQIDIQDRADGFPIRAAGLVRHHLIAGLRVAFWQQGPLHTQEQHAMRRCKRGALGVGTGRYGGGRAFEDRYLGTKKPSGRV